jgi:hypothetical protein
VKCRGKNGVRGLTLLPRLATIVALSAAAAFSQQTPAPAGPDSALTDALSAACRQDAAAFANSLTVENAAAFRALPPTQRTAIMKRFVLLEEPGRVLLSTAGNGQKIVRCESPSYTSEMHLGETRLRENLAFIPMEIPAAGENARAIKFGLVREGGGWKLLSVGLMLLDVPSMAKQWEQSDIEATEDTAIADLRAVAVALATYHRAYGKWPDILAMLGPAPADGVSPDAAGLLDADLAAGSKDGYSLRYTVIPATQGAPDDDPNKEETFSLTSWPREYGKSGRRSFFLDSSGVLRGADKQGGMATFADPRIGTP